MTALQLIGDVVFDPVRRVGGDVVGSCRKVPIIGGGRARRSAGKGQYARSEIARREQEDGELGLVALDYTPLYYGACAGRAIVLPRR